MIRLVPALLILAIALPAQARAPLSARPAPQASAILRVATPTGPVAEVTLANGLKVLLKENHASPVVSWVVSYKVGSRNEGPGITGSAHLLEHMMFKGTKTLGKGQVAQILDRNGANSNASTWQDWTRYFETYSSDRLELGLMIESARMRDALILDKERQSEMTVVRNELERGESDPNRQLYYAMFATAFKAHPYHHPTIGWRSDVEGVSTAQLKKFYDTYYQPNNAVAVLVGDFKLETALPLIHRYFDPLPKGPTPPTVHTIEEPQLGERRVVLRRRGQTNMLQLGFHIPAASSKDIAPLLVLDSVLSNGVTGRMYQALVEKKIATSAWTDVGVNHDPSLFRAGATLEPGADHLTVERALMTQLDGVKAAPVTALELAKAKSQAEADYVYENEGTQGVAFSLASYACIDRWQRGVQLLDEIKAVTAADLQRVAKSYLNADNRTVAWYVGTPDGPVPPAVSNMGGGKAEGKGKRGDIHAPYAFERHDAPPRHTIPPVRQTLSNGMVLITLENPESQTVALDGYVQGGSLEDPTDRMGAASATAALLDAGTAKRTKLQLAEDLEGRSISLGFSAGTTVTSLSGRCLAKDTDPLLGALAETLMTPTFPQAELDKLKQRWSASIRQAEDQPGTRASRAFSQLLYPPGHPFYVDELGKQLADVAALKREDLVAYHQRYHGPNKAVLVLVGKLKAADVASKLTTLFAGWPKAAGETPMHIANVPLGPGKRVVVAMPDKTNVDVRVGHATPLERTSPDYLAASLANFVLGGSTLTGRLGLKLRDEMGLTYGVSSGFSAGLGGGNWRAGVTVNPANVETAQGALAGELTRFLKDGLTGRELEFARSAFIGGQAVGLATNAGMAGSLSNIELYGLGLDYWARYPRLVRAVTVDAANQAARKLIHPDKLHTVIVGPVKP
ncbi:MAG: peptidase domain protein [Cyanobacteria bacterium RYN_339]|nr:peptidase domain protein [Cyanobacteria bacterium RYN_339]